jgi:O-acetyl-ADP-ribose deacetylase (regulator of RNase III)
MPIEFVSGDIFQSDAQTIGHGCNCRGKMGAGIAVEFKRRHPEMFQEYRRRCHKGEFNPGAYYLYKDATPWVLNLATQDSSRGATLEYVEQCLQNITEHYEELGITSLALPRIGAGLGGLDWDAVKALMVRYLGPLDLPVTVYEEFIKGIDE